MGRKKTISSQTTSHESITFKCSEGVLEKMHELVRLKIYPSRSELIRRAIKNLLDDKLYKPGGIKNGLKK